MGIFNIFEKSYFRLWGAFFDCTSCQNIFRAFIQRKFQVQITKIRRILISFSMFVNVCQCFKNRRKNKKLFGSSLDFLRNLAVVFWHILRNLTNFWSEFLIFTTDKNPVRNFFDQKLPKVKKLFRSSGVVKFLIKKKSV